jgi:hypothetical protein
MRIDAYVIGGSGSYDVSFCRNGEEFDRAEGFDDELEAVEAARRGVYGIGTVHEIGDRHFPHTRFRDGEML